MLHALRLEIDHPATGVRMAFEAPVPGRFGRRPGRARRARPDT